MLGSCRTISRKGVRLGNFSAFMSRKGAMASRRSTAASVMSGSNAASQRCGRSTIGDVGGMSGVQNQIAFRAADARQAGALFRLGVRRFQVIHFSRFNGDQARTATAGAATGVNPHALRAREVEQVSGGR